MSLHKLININSLNNNKKTIKIKANDEDLLLLANKLSVLKVISLECNIEITRNINRFRVEGELLASIIQECANSLDEVASSIKIPLKRIYEKTNAKDAKDAKLKQVVIYEDDEEEIDFLEKDSIDLEFLILEELLLNINPFVKKKE